MAERADRIAKFGKALMALMEWQHLNSDAQVSWTIFTNIYGYGCQVEGYIGDELCEIEHQDGHFCDAVYAALKEWGEEKDVG